MNDWLVVLGDANQGWAALSCHTDSHWGSSGVALASSLRRWTTVGHRGSGFFYTHLSLCPFYTLPSPSACFTRCVPNATLTADSSSAPSSASPGLTPLMPTRRVSYTQTGHANMHDNPALLQKKISDEGNGVWEEEGVGGKTPGRRRVGGVFALQRPAKNPSSLRLNTQLTQLVTNQPSPPRLAHCATSGSCAL